MKDIYQVAASKARTVWLRNLLLEMLPQLSKDSTDYHTWFDSLIEVMQNRGLVEPTQQKDYLSDVRNAIKILNSNHSALEVVDFDKETWTQINNRSSDRIAERTTKLIEDPDAIVERATILLESYHWSEIAAGLAVLTGRRCTEVIKTAQFKYKTPYSVVFQGSLKRRGEPVECIFEIPTLCEATKVIDAVIRLRNYLGVEVEHLSKRQVSSRYAKAVAKMCDDHFSELVPPRKDKDNLYTHLFRAVYATIALYWYCPPTIPEIEFKAAIQGHYQILDEKNPELKRSIAAGRNYSDYKISDGFGNIDGRLGIKLHLPGVQVLTQFQSEQDYHLPNERNNDLNLSSGKSVDNSTLPDKIRIDSHTDERSLNPKFKNSNSINKSQNSSTMNSSANSSSNSSIAIPSFFLSRLTAISDRLEISQTEAVQALFTWTEMGLSLAEQLSVEELTPQAIFEAVEFLQSSIEKESLSAANSSASSMATENTEESVLFERNSINELCTTVRLLSETLFQERQEKKLYYNHYPTDELETKNTNNKQNNSSLQSKAEEKASSIREDRQIQSKQSVNKAIDVIMEFNNNESIPTKDKWRIGIGALRKLTKRGDQIIKQVLKSREEEIEQHNSLHGLGKWHNARGKDYPSIDEVIKFEDPFIDRVTDDK